MKSRRLIANFVLLTINLVVLYFLMDWVIDNIHPELLLENIRRIPISAIALPIALNILTLAIYALRLKALMETSFKPSFHVVSMGSGLNAILPFRIGELVKLYFARKMYSFSALRLFSAGLVEKFFDLIALGGLVSIVVLASTENYIGERVIFLLFGLIAITYAFVLLFRKLADRIENRLFGLIHLRMLIGTLLEHSRVGRLGYISTCTLAIWVFNVAVVYVAFARFLPSIEFRVIDAISILVIVALAVAIPGAPAGIGIFEAGVVAYLVQALQVEKETALACAIVFHIVLTLYQIAFTAWILAKNLLKRG